MAYRRKSYTYWDGDAIFPIPFEYLEQDDILVFINDEQTTDFVIENTQVKLNNKPLEVPAIIKIVSATDIDKAAVEWENVSSLDEDNLILSDNQIRYAVQELYDNTEQFKTDTQEDFQEFREEIYTLLDDVSEAAELISSTIEAVDTAVLTTQEQALIATEQKELATEQANIAIAQTELVASTANKALEDIETLVTNSTDVIESLSEKSTEEINTLGNTIKSDATDWIDVINATGKSYNMVTHRQLTNCITEIPQDIKLELNNGVLTLKAGSKVYVPNGFEADGVTPKFDEVTIESDISNAGGAGLGSFLFYDVDNKIIRYRGVSTCSSGASDPATNSSAYYQTNQNIVNYYTGAGVKSKVSLPLAIIYGTDTAPTSIDQVFNGFGYIGSTIFVTKGIKCLIPNGRNEDGTLKNIEFTTDKVLTRTLGNDFYSFGLELSNNDDIVTENSITIMSSHYYYESSFKPNTNEAKWFNTLENQFYYFNPGHSIEILRQLYKVKDCTFGFVKVVNGTISSFNPKLPFRAIDYSDKPTVSGWSMPSNKYIDLAVGASGTTYTAVANGYFAVYPIFSANGWASIYNESKYYGSTIAASVSQVYMQATLPVAKNDVIVLNYANVSRWAVLKFIYAEGEV